MNLKSKLSFISSVFIRYLIVIGIFCIPEFGYAQEDGGLIDELISSSIFWLEANQIEAELDESVGAWTSSSDGAQFVQTITARQPVLTQGPFNNQNVLSFNTPPAFQFLQNNTNLDIISGSRTFIVIYRSQELTHGLCTRGASFSGNPPEGSFGIFPFQNENRIIWTENGTIRDLRGPNLVPNQYYYLRIELDRDASTARFFYNSEIVDSIEISSNYNATNLSPFQIGAYSSAFLLKGEIQFFACLDRVMNSEESEALDLYLGSVYGNFPIDLGENIVIEPNEPCLNTFEISNEYSSIQWSNGEESNTNSLDGPGELSILARDTMGFLYADTVRASFGLNTINNNQTICSYDSLLWDLGISDSFIFDWNDGSAESFNYLAPGSSNSVVVTHPLGCQETSDNITVFSDQFPEIVAIEPIDIFCLGNELFLASGAEETESYLWNTDEETPNITPLVSGEFWVEATNVNGCVGRDTVNVEIVGVAPEVDFTVGTACAENEVVFSDATIPEDGEVVEWEWAFDSAQAPGSGSPEFDSAQVPEFANVYSSEGSYPVTLTVVLDNGCTGTISDTIVVNPLPLMACQNCSQVVCKDLEVTFNSGAAPPEDISSYSWSFSNGVQSGDLSISEFSTVFDELGPASLVHYATTTAGCTDSTETINFEVLGLPNVNFSYDTACAGSFTSFFEEVDISESGPVWYSWDFDGQGTSSFPQAFWEFDEGVHIVTLTATGNNSGEAGCVSESSQAVYVFGSPIGDLEAGEGCAGNPIILSDNTLPSELNGIEDPIVSRAWYSLEDPENPIFLGSDAEQVVNFGNTGTIPILLEFETAAGCSGSANGTAFVEPQPISNFELILEGTGAPTSGFTVNNSQDAVTYSWSVNGSFVSDEEEPELKFEEPGDYTIELVVFNSLGCADTSAQAISLFNPEYDLALVQIFPEVFQDQLILRLQLENQGNARIENFDLEISMGTAFRIKDNYSFTIEAGEVRVFTVPTEIAYDPDVTQPYVCVVADNPNGVGDDELDLENNSLCEGFVEEEASFIPPYPNPTSEVLNLGFVLPRDGRVAIEVNDSNGKMVVSLGLDLKKGYSLHSMDVRSWSEGLYFVKYDYRNQEVVEKVVISR